MLPHEAVLMEQSLPVVPAKRELVSPEGSESEPPLTKRFRDFSPDSHHYATSSAVSNCRQHTDRVWRTLQQAFGTDQVLFGGDGSGYDEKSDDEIDQFFDNSEDNDSDGDNSMRVDSLVHSTDGQEFHQIKVKADGYCLLRSVSMAVHKRLYSSNIAAFDLWKRVVESMLDPLITSLFGDCPSATDFRAEVDLLLNGAYPGEVTLRMLSELNKRRLHVYRLEKALGGKVALNTTYNPAQVLDNDSLPSIHLLFSGVSVGPTVTTESDLNWKDGHYDLLVPSSEICCFSGVESETVPTESDQIRLRREEFVNQVRVASAHRNSMMVEDDVIDLTQLTILSNSNSSFSSSSSSSLSSSSSSSSSSLLSSSDPSSAAPIDPARSSSCLPPQISNVAKPPRIQYETLVKCSKDSLKRKIKQRLDVDLFDNDMRTLFECCADASTRPEKFPIYNPSSFEVSAVYRERLRHWTSNTKDRRQTVIDSVQEASRSRGGKGPKKKYNLTFRGEKVCGQCFCAIYGIDRATLTRYIQQAAEGVVNAQALNSRGSPDERTSFRKSRLYAQAWGLLSEIIQRDVQSMPHDEVQAMPQGSIQEIVDEVNVMLNMTYGVTCSDRLIYMILKEDFPNVKCPKVKRFMGCALCDLFKDSIRKVDSPAEKDRYRFALNGHRVQQYEQRKK